MAAFGENEGIHMLEEFVCEAIHPPGLPRGNPNSPGVNDGMLVVEETILDLGRPAADEPLGRFAAAVSDLPDDYRALFTLRLSGLSLPEIAERLGTPPAVVAERLDRIVSRLGQ